MSRAKHAHTLIKKNAAGPRSGWGQPGSKAKSYQAGAKGVDQVSSTMPRRCFFRRGLQHQSVRFLRRGEKWRISAR